MTISISELEAARAAMTPAAEYKAEASWNNGGMPLADFTIPGHSNGATVEMLAGDAFGIVATHLAADALILIARTALELSAAGKAFEDFEVQRTGAPEYHRLKLAAIRAEEVHLAALAKVML